MMKMKIIAHEDLLRLLLFIGGNEIRGFFVIHPRRPAKFQTTAKNKKDKKGGEQCLGLKLVFRSIYGALNFKRRKQKLTPEHKSLPISFISF